MKKKAGLLNRKICFVAAILILALVVFSILFWPMAEDERIIKEAVIADLPNTAGNIENATIEFEKIEISGGNAQVDVMLDWGPWTCAGYNYNLQKTFGGWVIISSQPTIIC